jgi:hypothetical protein
LTADSDPGYYPPMTEEIADKIYGILVRIGGAPENMRQAFVEMQSTEYVQEWRFGGLLGTYTDFWRDSRGWRIYHQCDNQTPNRDQIAGDMTSELRRLWVAEGSVPDIKFPWTWDEIPGNDS